MKLFDYGNISEQQKEAVLEIMDLAKQQGNEVFAEILKHKFQIEEPVRVDHSNHIFTKACEESDIKLWVMGWVRDGDDETGAPYYPVVSITEDIRKIDTLIDNIRKYQ